MDHISVPATVRSRSGADAVMRDVGLLDGWMAIVATEIDGPSFTVDACTWRRLIAAGERLVD